MYYNEFTELLRQTRRFGKWKVDGSGALRVETALGPMCPIAAVTLLRHKKQVTNGSCTSTDHLGLSKAVVDLVTRAADSRTNNVSHIYSNGRTIDVNIRKDLLSAAGVTADGCEPASCGG